MMISNAYLLITDLHLFPTLVNRKDYLSELLPVLSKIESLLDSYREKGYHTHLIFLGDIFHRGFSKVSQAFPLQDIIRYLCSKADTSYSLVGNHELSYYKENPFWYLISELEDLSLRDISTIKQPLGTSNVLRIPAFIRDGDTTISFNHYGTNIKLPDANAKVNIGLFHQDIGDNDITRMWGEFTPVESISNYDYCFFGHLHQAYGKYQINGKFTAYYLGSLGRTNHIEVDDSNLERMIPVIITEDGKFQNIEEHTIILLSRAESISAEALIPSNTRSISSIDENSVLETTSLYDNIVSFLRGHPTYTLFQLLDTSPEHVQEIYNDFLRGL